MDILEHAMNGIGKVLAKMLFNKEEDNEHEIFLEQSESISFITAILNAMMAESEFNEAENFLFDLLEESFNEEVYKLGIDFFEKLRLKTEDQLKVANYSYEEIEQGIADLNKLKQKALSINYDEESK